MKMLFLEFKNPSHWESCQHILNELKLAYGKAFPENFKVISLGLNEDDWSQDLACVKEYGPDVVVFGDHRLRIPLWVQKIKQELMGRKISWGIHVYGCFTGRVDEWIALEKSIGNDKVVFISGTEAHEKIVTSFFVNPDNVRTFRFPFQANNSFVNNDLRNKLREQYGLKKNDEVFIYAGRISYQKNVHHLVQLFSKYAKKNPRLKLIICGMPDDKNPRAIPYSYYMNYAGSLFFQALEASQGVTYIGQFSHDKLQEFYHACDYVISLSTFYGEDYGLSLIEGLSKGLGCVATRWGGHRDLVKLPQAKLIDVYLREGNLVIDEEQLDEVFGQVVRPDKKLNLIHFIKERTQDQSSSLREIFHHMSPFEGVSKKAFIFQIKDNEAWKGKEFFEVHEKILRPYWE